MKKAASLVLLLVGVVLIAFGISASDSVGSAFSRLFTGTPTDKTIWLIIGGAVATTVGLAGIIRRS
ncbi:MAG: DUF3185 family protein [Opitutaceae bacterium]|nr:DUF3185 family protein [Opitutaceae bacterium]